MAKLTDTQNEAIFQQYINVSLGEKMDKKLIILARIEAKNDKIELVKAALLTLIEPTLKETGCIQYHLHQDNEKPSVFVFYEIWESRELWQQHLSSVHILEHRSAVDGAISSFTLNEMTHL
jgi:quinol monooxygenase YgiN